MPHHWWLIDPDNPGPKQRAKAVRRAARESGGEVLFVGRARKNTWFALVNVEDPDREDEVFKAVGGRGKLFELEAVGEDDDGKRRKRDD
ncbi:MAG TPA: hypothetical protein VD769_10765 [Gaiellaceae bacterium]|nr:hypothetical protein [Gaiellaceae bacterium]